MSDSGTSARGGAVHPGRDTHAASLRVGFVAGPTLGPPLLLHLGLEDVPRPLLQLVADPPLVVAEDRPVVVVELLDDLKRPAPVEYIAADQSDSSRSATASCPAARSLSHASPSNRSA